MSEILHKINLLWTYVCIYEFDSGRPMFGKLFSSSCFSVLNYVNLLAWVPVIPGIPPCHWNNFESCRFKSHGFSLSLSFLHLKGEWKGINTMVVPGFVLIFTFSLGIFLLRSWNTLHLIVNLPVKLICLLKSNKNNNNQPFQEATKKLSNTNPLGLKVLTRIHNEHHKVSC